MEETRTLNDLKKYVHSHFGEDATGHGYDHMRRVAHWSRYLALQEGVSPFVAEVTGWLHDIGDSKLFEDPATVKRERDQWLQKYGFTPATIALINEAIESVSFRTGRVPDTMLGKVVQDADRLDALGAIGIARTFAYGGAKGQMIDSDNSEQPTSIRHFHDKLLKLSPLMNTESGRVEAEKRTRFILGFLEEYELESNVLQKEVKDQ